MQIISDNVWLRTFKLLARLVTLFNNRVFSKSVDIKLTQEDERLFQTCVSSKFIIPLGDKMYQMDDDTI